MFEDFVKIFSVEVLSHVHVVSHHFVPSSIISIIHHFSIDFPGFPLKQDKIPEWEKRNEMEETRGEAVRVLKDLHLPNKQLPRGLGVNHPDAKGYTTDISWEQKQENDRRAKEDRDWNN